MSAADLARQLQAKRAGSGWQARCPAHDDHRASLSIGEGEGGRLLLKCFAGCDFASIIKAAGIEPTKSNGEARESIKSKIVATYDYRDARGELVFQVVRKAPKDFPQRRPDGNGGWIWNMQGVELVPYRLPQLLNASEVYICEGEKDCDNLAKLGLVATTNPQGAGKWPAKIFSGWFEGRHVTILPDNDEPGRKHARDVASKLHDTAASIRILELPGLGPKGDVSDWLDAGGTAEQLHEFASKAPYWDGTKTNGADTGPEMFTVAELLALEFKPVKWIVPDVVCEGLTLFAGRPKLGKSWCALDWSQAVAGDGLAFGSIECITGDVLVLALEDSKRRLQDRLKMYRAKPNQRITISVKWPRINEGGIEAIKHWLDQHSEARLIVIDTLTKVRPRGIPNKDAYQADADALTELHALANERAVAIVVVHHTRKALADDWLDSVSGTTGLTGVADSTIVLKRERGQADAFLFGTGRDMPEYELPLKFNEQTCRWAKLDMSADEAHATSDQAAILRALRSANGAGLMRGQIAKMTDRSPQATTNMLSRMEAAGLVETRGNLWHLTVG
jgi:hypothetical protein